MDAMFSNPTPASIDEVIEEQKNSEAISDDQDFIDVPIDNQNAPIPQTPEELFPPITDIDIFLLKHSKITRQ